MASGSHDAASRVVLITGASSGIGLECARHLASRGHRVYGTSRRATAGEGAVHMLPLDVNDDASVAACVASVLERESRIDVLVNNAGFGLAGAIEETTIDEARSQFDTNVFGPLRMCRAVLPHMRQARRGLIVNMSSIAGLVPVPFQAMYGASKAALEFLSESMRMELRPFGVHVALLEPGDFKTGFTANRVRIAAANGDSPYRQWFERALAVMERDERNAPPPTAIARKLEQLVAGGTPRLRHPIAGALQRAAPMLRQTLPSAFYEKLMCQTYDIA